MVIKNKHDKIRILLTGARGFLGRNLLIKLKEHNISVTEGDIYDRENCINLEKEFDAQRFNLICHLGASSKRSGSILDIIKKNIVITNKIFSCASKNSDLKVIFASANSIVGSNSEKKIGISSSPNPKDVYSISKLIGEIFLRDYISEDNRVIVRLPAIYGDEKNKEGFLNRIITLSKAEKDIVITNANGLFNNAIMFNDAVDFFLKIILNYDEYMGKEFFLGSEDEMKFIDIVNLINSSLSSSSKVVVNDENEIINKNYVIDISEAKKYGFKTNSLFSIIKSVCNNG